MILGTRKSLARGFTNAIITKTGDTKIAKRRALRIWFILLFVFLTLWTTAAPTSFVTFESSDSSSHSSSWDTLVKLKKKYANLIWILTIANEIRLATMPNTKAVKSKGIDLYSTPNGCNAPLILLFSCVCNACRS